MMEGAAGRALVDDAVDEAIAFRQEMTDVGSRMSGDGTWWFSVFQPPGRATGRADGGVDDPGHSADGLVQATWQLTADAS